jgi:putative addiction module component (TIGR02574 family)
MLDYQSVLTAANQLPIPERFQLLEELWENMPSESIPPLSDEWLAEIRRRSDEFDAGKVPTISWEEVRAAALRRVGINVSR